jgi:uncharacterized protein YjiS (DUF1127 family)
MTMFTNDFGLNRERASPLFRVTKPASHLFETVMALTDSLVHGAERAVVAVGKWHQRRRTYAELAQLDDHLLRDIGISRDALTGRFVPTSDARRFDAERGGRF